MELFQLTQERRISGAAYPEQAIAHLPRMPCSAEEVEPEIEALSDVEHSIEEARPEDEVDPSGHERKRQQNDVLEAIEPELQVEDQQISNECSAGGAGSGAHRCSRGRLRVGFQWGAGRRPGGTMKEVPREDLNPIAISEDPCKAGVEPASSAWWQAPGAAARTEYTSERWARKANNHELQGWVRFERACFTTILCVLVANCSPDARSARPRR